MAGSGGGAGGDANADADDASANDGNANAGNGNANGGGGEDGLGLASVLAVATALITGIGALTITGVLGRVQRNHGEELAWALGLAVVGAGVWLLATLMPDGKVGNVLKLGFRFLAVVIVLIGVVLGFGTAVNTANDSERPAVTLEWDGKTATITAGATAGNLSSEDRLAVTVDGLQGKDGAYDSVTNLSRAFVGPDGDGNASHKIKVVVPPGRYDAVGVSASTDEKTEACGEEASRDPLAGGAADVKDSRGTGCALLPLPARPSRPRLIARWAKAQPLGRVLLLRLAMANTEGAPKRLIGLQVVALGQEDRQLLYRATISPHSAGTVHRRLRLPVAPGTRRICARATVVESGERLGRVTCPLRMARANVAAVDLHVPTTDDD